MLCQEEDKQVKQKLTQEYKGLHHCNGNGEGWKPPVLHKLLGLKQRDYQRYLPLVPQRQRPSLLKVQAGSDPWTSRQDILADPPERRRQTQI